MQNLASKPTPRLTPQLTPMMRQYLEIKDTCKDAILFFRMGDFYEMFFEDAETASKLLGLTLTTRDKSDPDAPPMCGIPYHAANKYIAQLIREGYKVAVCDQVEDPKTAKGIVKREITRIITPGIAFDEELLDAKANNFAASVVMGIAGQKKHGFAYLDATTGDFRVAEFNDIAKLLDEIKRINPKELILPEGIANDSDVCASVGANRVSRINYRIDYDRAVSKLAGHFQVASMDGFGCSSMKEGLIASSMLLHYVKDTQKAGLEHIKRLSPYNPDQFMTIDAITKKNLELTENMQDGSKKWTLLGLMDKTRTAMGARRLRYWMDYPLMDVVEINKRLDAVSELFADRLTRQDVQGMLVKVYDLERLAGRMTLPIAAPRDMTALQTSLEQVPLLKEKLSGCNTSLLKGIYLGLDSLEQVPLLKEKLSGCNTSLLKGIYLGLDNVEEVVGLIKTVIADNPPNTLKDGGVIRNGCNKELDNLREIRSSSRAYIARLETEEKARTGINSLKVRFNNVFGYYIEITKANLSQVPSNYVRKQTLANAERFITAELKELETKILNAEERAVSLEYELFHKLRTDIGNYIDRIQMTANLIAGLDVLTSLAQTADEFNYTRPFVNTDDVINITGGRHPVIEASLSERFVPNDICLDQKENQILVITGPNMAGKSTYLRQTALITFMAQVGSFVPADEASIGIVDRIFTRVGASDDITKGNSTFMVEMTETANILNNATSKSLIRLDEIGRGTSTYDGLSIAWAVAEYIHDMPCIRAKTLFATHYHELTELS
ncbi:MAG: DNA mismatch repair protein MutS, partial [Deltaproteobacteria bacterium]|nr:DNA mismatch repair protein MutS [Deltaproteobacteria bacterium]